MSYNRILENLILPTGDFLNRSNVIGQLKYWRSIQHFSESELVELQNQKLKSMLGHAATSIPYYSGLAKANDRPIDWLKSFPVIRKKDIKGNWDRFIDPSARDLIAYESSGSSGIQGKVYMSKKTQSTIRAIMLLWWEWAGYHFGKRIMQTGMTPQRGILKSLKDWLLQTEYMVAFELGDETMYKHLRKAEKRKFDHLAGYASSLYLLAKTAMKNDMDIRFNSVISWGDKMFDHYRSSIETAFETRVYDTYACNEGLMIAAQRDHEFYYQMSPHIFLELLDENGRPVPDGELGFVVVTSLDNYAMPLIRYYVGDLAVKLPRHRYPERRDFNFPLLERVIGRDTDIIKTRSGKFLIVHFFTGIFEFYPSIRQFRVIQTSLDFFTIEYIKEQSFEASVLEEIHHKIQDHLGEKVSIDFVNVEFIPPTPSGKPQIIKSEI